MKSFFNQNMENGIIYGLKYGLKYGNGLIYGLKYGLKYGNGLIYGLKYGLKYGNGLIYGLKYGLKYGNGIIIQQLRLHSPSYYFIINCFLNLTPLLSNLLMSCLPRLPVFSSIVPIKLNCFSHHVVFSENSFVLPSCLCFSEQVFMYFHSQLIY